MLLPDEEGTEKQRERETQALLRGSDRKCLSIKEKADNQGHLEPGIQSCKMPEQGPLWRSEALPLRRYHVQPE